jgi:hypothetical protein
MDRDLDRDMYLYKDGYMDRGTDRNMGTVNAVMTIFYHKTYRWRVFL